MLITSVSLVIYFMAQIATITRVLLVDNKEPASRAAWVLVLLFVPILGILAYLLLGETWISPRLRRQAEAIDHQLADEHFARDKAAGETVPDRYHAAFQNCACIAHDRVVGYNTATLADDGYQAIDMLVQDIDRASESVHISFYIWLTDHNGCRVIEAVRRAARRGVKCRIIADGIGSRALINSSHWQAMQQAGAMTCVSMKVSRGLEFFQGSRVDLRNHRKIVVVDNRITYCGSQNCADPAFRIKPKFAPWVDIMLRFEGPVVRQHQRLFIGDWMVENGEDISSLVRQAEPAETATTDGFPAIAFGTGPISPQGAMSTVFAGLLTSAEHEVVISNPYFVPDPVLINALLFCARRGVDTRLILPARNDAWIVSLISKSYYPQLLDAGVRILEYNGGLLHAKTLVVDGRVSLIGSANMDRRSLDLNFENNILLHSVEISGRIRRRQAQWLADSTLISADSIADRPRLRRIAKNLATIFAPIM